MTISKIITFRAVNAAHDPKLIMGAKVEFNPPVRCGVCNGFAEKANSALVERYPEATFSGFEVVGLRNLADGNTCYVLKGAIAGASMAPIRNEGKH